jgi:hypothetical protein
MEVLNSSAQQSDYMRVYRDWFALLNYGYRTVAVGSSDGHDVSRYIVGQGRTYIRCPDGDPGDIPVDTALSALLKGRALVSMGLLVDMSVDDRFQVGDLATECVGEIKVNVDVRSPAWMSATNVTLFANGVKIRGRSLANDAGSPNETRVEWMIPRPAHDVHLVAMATGPGVTAPYWAIPRPYQPSSKEWSGRVIGSTNPIWLDADGDGEFTASRKYAKQLIDRHGHAPGDLIPSLKNYDETVASQAAALCVAAGIDIAAKAFDDAPKAGSENSRRGFAAYSAAVGDDIEDSENVGRQTR